MRMQAWWYSACCLGFLLAGLTSTGCQIVEGGQTLPSAFYLEDDVQYHPAGSEFTLPREAAALKEARAQQQLP